MSLDTIILAGGLGTRIKEILGNTPKCLAPVNGKPFIDILIDNCVKQGIKRIIICVGYSKDQIIKYLSKRQDIEIIFSKENTQLGTGGAIKNAKKYINSESFLVLNGDSYIDFNISSLFKKQMGLISSILLYKNNDNKDFGKVSINNKGILTSFNEKNSEINSNYLSAGRYIFSLPFLLVLT